MDTDIGGKAHEPGGDKTAENAEILRRLAEKLGKHEKYVPKPPGERASEAGCERVVRTVIPPGAGITAITFSANNGEVTIGAERPGLAIGRLGTHLKAIRELTGWKPIITRAPPGESRE